MTASSLAAFFAPRSVAVVGASRDPSKVGGSVLANLRSAGFDRATQAEGLARQQIEKEVNQAALMLGAAEKSVEASQKGLKQAGEEFRIVQERFGSGRGIQLEILDAQASTTRARFNAVSALADYHTALAMWLRATGRPR